MNMRKDISIEDFENSPLVDRLSDEADQCRNDGADDIAKLLDEARSELERLGKDAERYRWLCANNFDREGAAQVHTWLKTWEPHSQTGEPTEWKQRIRGGALDAAIDAAMKGQK